MMSRARDLGITVAQYGIAVVALSWLLTQFDITSAIDLLAGVKTETALAVIAVSILGICGRAYTWHAVITPLSTVRFRTAAGTTLIVNFVNQLLPSRLSGRLAAPFVLRSQTGMDYSDAAAASALHTAVFALYYGIAATAGLVLAIPLLRIELLVVLALATTLYFVAGLAILFGGLRLTYLDRLIGWLSGVAVRVPRVGKGLAERLDGLLEFTDSSTTTFRSLASEPAVWLRYAIGWAVDLVLAPGVRVGLLLGSFGVGFEPLVAVPLYLLVAYTVTLLPLTPGGIGITEATATAVFVALGIPAEVIIPIIFVDRFLSIYLPSLAGWYPSVRLDVTSLTTE
ncbi:lysylphosphatidylglycerol synthase transmembrane domain-containing protein [Haloarcula rubripromontorii]|uniref:lysylphosphatidylglycerol synthase transmembrane domain-containing protein n=1 Tax=Haloarcula rubripromontorii TaxID=1705562 RepID=UPI00345B4DB3